MPRTDLTTMVKYLLEAPRVVQNMSTMTWMTLLEPPKDGTLLLVWQRPSMIDFATDGYVWSDVEKAFSQACNGYVSGPIELDV